MGKLSLPAASVKRRYGAPGGRLLERGPGSLSMEWTDEGVVLGVRRHGERSAIVEALTAAHGRHLGLVRDGRSRRMTATLQPGNCVALTWRARLDEHLGAFAVEPLRLRPELTLGDAATIDALNWLCSLLRLLPERDPQAALYAAAEIAADHLTEAAHARALIARIELATLEALGFGLDLSRCAATGSTQDLAYVSPKTGRAVGREAGAPWAGRLLALPAFLRGALQEGGEPGPDEIEAGLALTGFFLERDVFHPRGTQAPPARAAFMARGARRVAQGQSVL